MKLAQQQLLNLLKVGAIICYLLLLLVHFDPKNIRSTNTSNIIDKLEYKMPVLGMVMVIIMFSLLIQTPMGAMICYLLLLLIHFDTTNVQSTNTNNIVDRLEYKMLVLGMFMVIIMFSLLVQTPIDVIDTVLPNPKYIPKRLRYRTR